MARFRRRFANQFNSSNAMEWEPVEINNQENLTLLTAAGQVVDVVRDSHYDSRIYEVAARPISYIAELLSLTEKQAVVYSIVMDMYYNDEISACDIADTLGITPLKAMTFSEDLDELCSRKYLMCNYDEDSIDKSYSVTKEAIISLKQNCQIITRDFCFDSAEMWFGELDKIVIARCEKKIDYDTFCQSVDNLINRNKNLPMIKRFKKRVRTLRTDDIMLFFWICNMVVSSGFETIVPDNFKKLYSEVAIHRVKRKSLATGNNALLKNGLLRVAKSGEQRSKDCYELTPWVVKEMLAELELDSVNGLTRDIIESSSITPKQLYYNATEKKAIEQLTELLQPARFAEVRNELVKQGFRSGFACLFYGAPGTGKTETVLQLARATGRDLMQVNISEIKSMWVGESEKNIKAIFTNYRKLAEESTLAPILLFNEADAIIGKRLENVSRSVDKMENAMQNIILEEIEKLDGILIATTNLTCNMDSAFERRFLYKVEFEKPSLQVKSSIWQTMLTGLSEQDAMTLALRFDFSGGQIENIARKSVVNRIISGKELSLDSLIDDCNAEMFDKRSNRKRVGFQTV